MYCFLLTNNKIYRLLNIKAYTRNILLLQVLTLYSKIYIVYILRSKY